MASTIPVNVSAGVWTKICTGPGTFFFSASDNFDWAEAPSSTLPEDDVAHLAYANSPMSWPLDGGQSIYVRNGHRPFRLALNLLSSSAGGGGGGGGGFVDAEAVADGLVAMGLPARSALLAGLGAGAVGPGEAWLQSETGDSIEGLVVAAGVEATQQDILVGTDTDKVVTTASVAGMQLALRNLSTPALVKGAVDLSTWGGVVVGALPDSTERTINGIALQAGFAWADANRKYIEMPAGGYEYIATGVQDGVNVGLQLTKNIPGLIGAGAGDVGTRLIQYGTNHPALTIGDVSADGNAATAWGTYRDIAVGYGVSQAGLTGAAGILFGRIYDSEFQNIAVNRYISGGDFAPYIGALFSPTNGKTFFFSNDFKGVLNVNAAQVSLVKYQANGTGNSFQSMYLGGGKVGNRIALSGPAVDIPGRYNLEFGAIQQFNVEWVSPAGGQLINNTANGLVIDVAHFEGVRMNDFSGSFIMNNSGLVDIRSMTILNPWIVAANASGTPSLIKAYGDAVYDIGRLRMICDGGAEQIASLGFRVYDEDTNVIGRNPAVRIDSIDLNGAGLTAAVALDPTHTAVAAGGNGFIGSLRSYAYETRRSRTRGAVITMGNADLTVYGQHRHALIKQTLTLTANRTLTLSDKLAASGAGSASVRPAGDILRVKREGGGAFNLVVNNQSGTALATFTGAASANTELAFEWSGSAWSAI